MTGARKAVPSGRSASASKGDHPSDQRTVLDQIRNAEIKDAYVHPDDLQWIPFHGPVQFMDHDDNTTAILDWQAMLAIEAASRALEAVEALLGAWWTAGQAGAGPGDEQRPGPRPDMLAA